MQEDGVQEHHPGQQSQIVLCPEEAQEDERVEEGEVVDNEGEEGEEDEEDKEEKGGGLSRRTRLPVYKKLLAIREADRFLEEGLKTGVEKKVMATFPEMFMGTKGRMKSGMLGRWMVQCDEQDWRKIPFEKMSNHDQQLKDLPDWIRLPMGLPPRSLDKFKSGTNIPGAVTRKIIEMIEKVTCGEGTRLTSGSVKVDSVKKTGRDTTRGLQQGPAAGCCTTWDSHARSEVHSIRALDQSSAIPLWLETKYSEYSGSILGV